MDLNCNLQYHDLYGKTEHVKIFCSNSSNFDLSETPSVYINYSQFIFLTFKPSLKISSLSSSTSKKSNVLSRDP